MNTRRESESIGYGFFGGRYAGMAGPFFSSGTSKTVGTLVFIINGQRIEWVEIPDPTGLKNFIKSIKKTMYDPLTKLESKRTRIGACPQCGIQNSRNAQFCNGCGSQLLQICSHCKQLNPIGSSFCSKCGSQLFISTTIDLSESGVSKVDEASFLECKSSENNIKINYPSTWTKEYDNSKPPVKAIIFLPPNEPANLVVTVDDTIGNISLDEQIQDFITKARKGLPDFKLIESTPSTLSGVAAHQITFSDGQTKRLIVNTIKNNVLYSIMYIAQREKYNKFLSSAEQMISSFEILN